VVAIKKKSLNAYIVIEAVLSLGLVAFITSLVIQQSVTIHRDLLDARRKVDTYQAAQMAVEAQSSTFSGNGLTLTVYQTPVSILVLSEGREVLRVQASN
jgi:NADH:ubiquinone oxidoreductase subunit 3 (subunit A)